MSNVKVKITRGTVIGAGRHAKKGDVVEVDLDTAVALAQAGAAEKPEEPKKDKGKAKK